MKIHEVALKTGLTKKSIRYYEDMGLLNPLRNSNDYREYTEEDLKNLELIKFLRELEVPIMDIKKLKKGDKSIKQCMEERLKKMEEKEKDQEKIKGICKSLASSNEDIKTINIKEYQNVVNNIGSKNYMVKDVKKSHREKIMGALLSSLLFMGVFGGIMIMFTYLEFTQEEALPLAVYFILMAILLVPFLGIIINLIKRIQEIKGGEEYEARKY